MILIDSDFTDSAYQTFSVNLGEFVCDFRIQWNERDGRFFCDFSSDVGENNGVRLVLDRNLLSANNRLGYDGNFRLLKVNNQETEDVSCQNFGSSYKLVFGNTEEWEEFDAL